MGPAEAEHEEEKCEVFDSATPPKNALLLMRCRSAPHRPAATFPSKLWASPSMAEGPSPSEKGTRGPSDIFPVKADGDREGGGDAGEAAAAAVAAAAVGSSPSVSSRLLILSRCKSEPAWRAAKLSALEAHNSFWNAAIATRLTAPRASTAAGTG